jgi:four helix bundle protein
MMAKGDDIQKRILKFAADILRLCDKLPTTRNGNHIAGQILRSGTSPAANYAEARGAESNKDFVHKLKIALKELNETEIWLSIITESELTAPQDIELVKRECIELSKMLNASIKTASRRIKGNSQLPIANCQLPIVNC